jgi:tetratricopeptide (TPR) repeat protein
MSAPAPSLRRSWVGLLGLLLAVPARAQFGPDVDVQRHGLEGLAPAPLLLPGPPERRKAITEVRIRFYADDDYRAGLFRWADRTRTQLGYLNQIVEQSFGVRFEAESFRRWHRESSNSDVHQMLAELEKLDAGVGVDWVVAYVSALPLVSAAIHEVGAARLLGKHFLLRGMASADEARALGQAFDKLDPAVREQLYTQRKWHKELAIFLHEWLHTLGALHSNDRQRIMNPTYSSKMSNLAIVDAELATTALQVRLEGRAREHLDWSPLLSRLEHASSPEWSTKEKDELLALLRSTGAVATGVVKTPGLAGASPGKGAGDGEGNADGATYKRAVALAREGKAPEAWSLMKPLAASRPDSLDVQRLLCRLGFVPAAREQGLAACARARTLDPDRPEVLIDEAQARILRKQPAEALAAADGAVELTARYKGNRDELWPWIAQIYAQLGALTRAEEVLTRVTNDGPGVDAARSTLLQERRQYGLPRPPAPGALPADKELAYAGQHQKVAALLEANKLREARVALEPALKQFPGVPGLAAFSCEIDVRSHRARPAEKACAQALEAMPDLPRAHYLMAHVHLQSNARQSAVDELRKSIALDPRAAGAYETLADVYRATGKRQDLATLRAEYQKIFSRPLH